MAKQWIVGRAFPAVVGKDYEVAFGNITYMDQTGMWTAKIRVVGSGSANWIDLDTGVPIDPSLVKYVVQAFIEI